MFLFFSMLLLCSFFRLNELYQVKNGLTTSYFFFWKMQKNWVGRPSMPLPLSSKKYTQVLIEHLRKCTCSKYFSNISKAK